MKQVLIGLILLVACPAFAESDSPSVRDFKFTKTWESEELGGAAVQNLTIKVTRSCTVSNDEIVHAGLATQDDLLTMTAPLVAQALPSFSHTMQTLVTGSYRLDGFVLKGDGYHTFSTVLAQAKGHTYSNLPESSALLSLIDSACGGKRVGGPI